MTGILSLLDTLLGTPMPEVVAPLAVPDEVAAALVGREGRFGSMLRLVEALERGDDDEVVALLAANWPGAVAELPRLQVAAMSWASNIATPAD
jgi:EAL and modified HD-GYP domain-containing signal transduction protein